VVDLLLGLARLKEWQGKAGARLGHRDFLNE
jgi:hypothetical protein